MARFSPEGPSVHECRTETEVRQAIDGARAFLRQYQDFFQVKGLEIYPKEHEFYKQANEYYFQLNVMAKSILRRGGVAPGVFREMRPIFEQLELILRERAHYTNARFLAAGEFPIGSPEIDGLRLKAWVAMRSQLHRRWFGGIPEDLQQRPNRRRPLEYMNTPRAITDVVHLLLDGADGDLGWVISGAKKGDLSLEARSARGGRDSAFKVVEGSVWRITDLAETVRHMANEPKRGLQDCGDGVLTVVSEVYDYGNDDIKRGMRPMFSEGMEFGKLPLNPVHPRAIPRRLTDHVALQVVAADRQLIQTAAREARCRLDGERVVDEVVRGGRARLNPIVSLQDGGSSTAR